MIKLLLTNPIQKFGHALVVGVYGVIVIVAAVSAFVLVDYAKHTFPAAFYVLTGGLIFFFALKIVLHLIHLKSLSHYQKLVGKWTVDCFGEKIAKDPVERNHRFLEEALELVQSLNCTQDEAHKLVDYVYSRPVGEPSQEVGGSLVTLAALCKANELNMQESGWDELERITSEKTMAKIRLKQARKPKHSPLAE